MIKCMKDGCGTQNPDGSKFCKHCGAPLSVWKTGLTVPAPTNAPTPPASAGGKASAADLQQALADVAKWKGEATRLDTELKSAQASLQKALADLAAAPNAQALAKAQTDLAAANQWVAQLERDVTAKGAEISRLTQDLQRQSGASADLVRARQDLTGAQDQVRAFQAEAGRLTAQVSQINGDLATARQRAADFERKWHASEAEVARLLSTSQGWRVSMRKYFVYGAGIFGGFVAFVVTTAIFSLGVSLPLVLLAAQLILIYRADWVVNVNGPTKIGWGVLMGPAFLLTLGMWIQIGGAPVVSWTVMNFYSLILPAAVFARARKP